jgi:hypothetical protein
MAGSSRTSFTKRQKERARQEKQAEKAQKRAQRKQEPRDTAAVQPAGEVVIAHDEDGQPLPLDFHDFES